MSFALIAARYTVSNAPTICASTVSGGVGKANGVGIGAIVLWASGCLACCSDVRVAVCSGATAAVCCGIAVGVSCATGEGLCSGTGVGVGVAGAGMRFGVGVALCFVTGLLPPLTKVVCNIFPLASM